MGSGATFRPAPATRRESAGRRDGTSEGCMVMLIYDMVNG